MTEPTRGARVRRGNRRPGSLLLTALLVLALVASSALVFTNEVELLKLAVVIALWAAVVGAFVSFIYRRQADLDQAKSRDLKLVYGLQLDREISARREYELSLETQLRRELTSELRAQASDEVASLRAELAALRANLEMIFDTDLQQRPALETERSERGIGPGRVISSRIDTEAPEAPEAHTEESPIIDVPAEPHPQEDEWAPPIPGGGAHRRPSEPEPVDPGWRPSTPPLPPPPRTRPPQEPARREGRRRASEPAQAREPEKAAEVGFPWVPPEPTPPPAQEPVRAATGFRWRPVPAEGHFIPAGAPGSNWTAPVEEHDATPPNPAMTPPPAEPVRPGRHADAGGTLSEEARRARHLAAPDADFGRRTPPTLATPSPAPTTPPQAAQSTAVPEPPPARHREPDESQEPEGQHIGGQPVSELMARLQVGSSGGGRRRRREE